MRNRAIIRAVGALTVLLSAAVRAETEQAMSLNEMIDSSDRIVVGRVVNSTPRWQNRVIVTDSTVEVSDALKGADIRRITVTQLGGTLEHPVLKVPVTQSVSGQESLAPGANVLLFLSTVRNTTQIVGGSQGQLQIETDATSGQRRVARGPRHLRSDRVAKGRVRIATEEITLDALRSRIAERVSGGQK